MSYTTAAYTPGSGGLLKVDRISSIDTPVSKVAFGVEGTVTIVDASNPLPIYVVSALPAGTNNIGDVDVLTVPADPFGANADAAVAAGAAGSIQAKLRRLTADLDAVKTAVELLDNAIDGTEMQVDVVSSALPSGAATSARQDTGNTLLSSLDSKVTAVNTGAVVVSSSALPTGAATAANQTTVISHLDGVESLLGDIDAGKLEEATFTGRIGEVQASPTANTVLARLKDLLTGIVLSAGSNIIGAITGAAAHDAAISGNPVRIAGRGMSADYTAVATGDTADVLTTLTGKPVNLPYALPGQTWTYAAAAGGLVSTAGVTAKAAAGANVRNYVTSIQVINSHATVGTEVCVKDGAGGTVLHRGWAAAAGGGYTARFDPPLRGTANTLIEIAEVTETGTAGVLVNLQGFTAAE